MRMIATGIINQVGSIYPSEEDTDNRKLSIVEDNGNSYSSSFHSGGANDWWSFWLFLVASSYFLLSKQVNYFKVKNPQEKFSLPITTSISNKISESDVYSEILDLYRASYMDSLLSLEEEDSEWLSDSMTENSSSPISYISADSFTDISDVDSSSYWDSLLRLEQNEEEENGTHYCGKSEDRASYMDSLLSLEEDDSEWLSDSMTENSSSPFSYISADSFTGISNVDSSSYWESLLRFEQNEEDENGTHYYRKSKDRASYMDSLLSLEDEDSEYWLSDSMTENPSSSISYISADSFTDISDLGSPSYWDSLLRLEESEEENGIPFGKSEDNNSAEHLLETTDIVEYFSAAEHEPLFWPYEGKFNWDSEESSFCTSPRRSLNSNIDLDYAFEREYFALDKIETLMGLKEFDGHEGLDSEFNGDIFVLKESLQ